MKFLHFENNSTHPADGQRVLPLDCEVNLQISIVSQLESSLLEKEMGRIEGCIGKRNPGVRNKCEKYWDKLEGKYPDRVSTEYDNRDLIPRRHQLVQQPEALSQMLIQGLRSEDQRLVFQVLRGSGSAVKKIQATSCWNIFLDGERPCAWSKTLTYKMF